MISLTQMAYGSRVARQGKSRCLLSNQANRLRASQRRKAQSMRSFDARCNVSDSGSAPKRWTPEKTAPVAAKQCSLSRQRQGSSGMSLPARIFGENGGGGSGGRGELGL